MDPAAVFCEGVMMIILGNLDMPNLAVCCLVSRGWLTLASDDRLWEPKLQELRVGKAHIPRVSKMPGISKMEATLFSILDGKRNRITMNDLCDHAWDFHCSEAARHQLDPNRDGSARARRYFHPDGSMTQGEGENVWNVNGSTFTLLVDHGEMRDEQCVRINLTDIVSNLFPHLFVMRRPDWGWVLADHLNLYASIPDADKVDGTGPSLHTLCLMIDDGE